MMGDELHRSLSLLDEALLDLPPHLAGRVWDAVALLMEGYHRERAARLSVVRELAGVRERYAAALRGMVRERREWGKMLETLIHQARGLPREGGDDDDCEGR